MLRSMAIRMKEWGMLAYPRQGVHLPLNALNDWSRTGHALGQGVAAAGTGAVELAEKLHQVAIAGSEADVAGQLETIARETTEELLDKPVRDWDYSWQQAYTPRVQQMLSELEGDAREQASRMSEVYGYRYSLMGRQRMEVDRLKQSRRQWQNQVDTAVQRGDAEGAQRWLEQGRAVFVPEADMEQQKEQVQSRCLQSRWRQRLQQEPYAALAAWNNDEEQKPQGEEELRILSGEVEQTRSGLRSAWALQLAEGVAQGVEPDASELQQAEEAGLISPELNAAARQPRQELSASSACNWLRRIDERGENDDEQLMVEIALAPIPMAERRTLLQRLQGTAAVPPQQRMNVSRRLWNMYHEGRFGSPGDEEALRCLGRLQEEAPARLAVDNGKQCEQWLDDLQNASDEWVCFETE